MWLLNGAAGIPIKKTKQKPSSMEPQPGEQVDGLVCVLEENMATGRSPFCPAAGSAWSAAISELHQHHRFVCIMREVWRGEAWVDASWLEWVSEWFFQNRKQYTGMASM